MGGGSRGRGRQGKGERVGEGSRGRGRQGKGREVWREVGRERGSEKKC